LTTASGAKFPFLYSFLEGLGAAARAAGKQLNVRRNAHPHEKVLHLGDQWTPQEQGRRGLPRRIRNCHAAETDCADASMGKDCIETVWGRGYMLREPDEVRISKACPRATDRDAA
jgi:hypothetical protein